MSLAENFGDMPCLHHQEMMQWRQAWNHTQLVFVFLFNLAVTYWALSLEALQPIQFWCHQTAAEPTPQSTLPYPVLFHFSFGHILALFSMLVHEHRMWLNTRHYLQWNYCYAADLNSLSLHDPSTPLFHLLVISINCIMWPFFITCFPSADVMLQFWK
jgi:hypothetical protein